MRTIQQLTTLDRAVKDHELPPPWLPRAILYGYWLLATICVIVAAGFVLMGLGALAKFIWRLLVIGWTAF